MADDRKSGTLDEIAGKLWISVARRTKIGLLERTVTRVSRNNFRFNLTD